MLRGTPSDATRSCVCGAPGLSTSTSLAGVVVGSPGTAGDGVPLAQSPKTFSTSGFSSSTVICPDTINAALFGTKFCDQNFCRSSRVIALFDGSVPRSV